MVICSILRFFENLTKKAFGGTMRKGLYEATLDKNSKTFAAYKTEKIEERHRHRYEFNNKYRSHFESSEMKIVGINEPSNLVEIIELKNHIFFVGVQFHPEFKSKPITAHPLFSKLVEAGIERFKFKGKENSIEITT